jgi:hypothetical protein
MKQALGLQQNKTTLNPGRCPWADMKQAFGLEPSVSSYIRSSYTELLNFGPNQEVADLVWIMTVFCCKIYGHRSPPKRKCSSLFKKPATAA